MITISISGDAGQAHIQKARELFAQANPASGVSLRSAEPSLEFSLDLGTVAAVGSALAGIATFILMLIRRSSETPASVPTRREDAASVLQAGLSSTSEGFAIQGNLREFREEPFREVFECFILVKGSGLSGAMEVEIRRDSQNVVVRTRRQKTKERIDENS